MYLLYPSIGFYYDSEKQQVKLNSKGLQMDFDMNDKVIFVFVVVNVILFFIFWTTRCYCCLMRFVDRSAFNK